MKIDTTLHMEDLDEKSLINYEVDSLDGHGRLQSTALIQGTVRKKAEYDRFVVVALDLNIQSRRPFLGVPWLVKERTVARKERAEPYAITPAGESPHDEP